MTSFYEILFNDRRASLISYIGQKVSNRITKNWLQKFSPGIYPMSTPPMHYSDFAEICRTCERSDRPPIKIWKEDWKSFAKKVAGKFFFLQTESKKKLKKGNLNQKERKKEKTFLLKVQAKKKSRKLFVEINNVSWICIKILFAFWQTGNRTK